MKELKEEIVGSEEIFRGRLLQVKIEKVTLPDGSRAQREVVYHPGAAAVVPLTKSGQVILVRQFRLPVGKALLEIPAGTLDKGEPPETCARRELAEEIGMRPGKLELLGSFLAAPGYSSELIYIFMTQELFPATAEADADERLVRVEMPLKDALQMVEKNAIQDGKTIAGLLLAAQRLSKAGS